MFERSGHRGATLCVLHVIARVAASSAGTDAYTAIQARESDEQERPMIISATNLSPALAIVFGLLILVFPRILNYLVAVYLILSGLLGLGVLAIR
jgi:hypothetical protein